MDGERAGVVAESLVWPTTVVQVGDAAFVTIIVMYLCDFFLNNSIFAGP